MHVHLEPLEFHHLESVRRLRNANRHWFFNSKPVTREQQCDWYESYLQSNLLFWVILYEGQVIGTISRNLVTGMDFPIKEGATAVYEIGHLTLLPEYQGRGLMLQAMEKVMSYGPLSFYIAHVKPNNAASLRLFKRAGFWRVPRARQ